MFCYNCGKVLNEDVSLCLYCGQDIKNENGITYKHSKATSKNYMIICIVVVLFVVFALFNNSNLLNSNSKDVVIKFEKYLKNGEYEKAYNLLHFTVDNKKHIGELSFTNFAKEKLNDCIVIKESDSYILKNDNDEFHVYIKEFPDGNKIIADDFIISYKVKYTSYMSSIKNSFISNPEKKDNGMTLYTLYKFKMNAPIEIDYDLLLGEEVGLTAQAKAVVKLDKNYCLSTIERIGSYFDSNAMDTELAYIDTNGVLILDRYGISESYSKRIATIFTNFMSELCTSSCNGESYDDFYKTVKNIAYDAKYVREIYQETINMQKYLRTYDFVDCSLVSWRYPKFFNYSDDSYIMEITIKAKIYNNGVKISDSNEEKYYVQFKPSEDNFKVYNVALSKEKLLNN